jgi:hypothetical protein
MGKQKRKLGSDVARFVTKAGKRRKGNDRQYDHRLDKRLRRMDAADVDQLMRDDESSESGRKQT